MICLVMAVANVMNYAGMTTLHPCLRWLRPVRSSRALAGHRLDRRVRTGSVTSERLFAGLRSTTATRVVLTDHAGGR